MRCIFWVYNESRSVWVSGTYLGTTSTRLWGLVTELKYLVFFLILAAALGKALFLLKCMVFFLIKGTVKDGKFRVERNGYGPTTTPYPRLFGMKTTPICPIWLRLMLFLKFLNALHLYLHVSYWFNANMAPWYVLKTPIYKLKLVRYNRPLFSIPNIVRTFDASVIW